MEFRIWVETRLGGRILERQLVAQVEREAAGIGPEEIGLSLKEGKTVLRQVQARMIQTQVDTLGAAHRQCRLNGLIWLTPRNLPLSLRPVDTNPSYKSPKLRFEPIFGFKVKDSPKFPRIVRDQHPVVGKCDASNQDIMRPDPLATYFQAGADTGRQLGRRRREWQDFKRGAKAPGEFKIPGDIPAAASSEE